MTDTVLESVRAELWALWTGKGCSTLVTLRALDREHGRFLDRVAIQPFEMCVRNGASPDLFLGIQDLRRQLQHELQSAITDLWECSNRIRTLTAEMEQEGLALKESSSIRVTIQLATETPQRFADGIKTIAGMLTEIQQTAPERMREMPLRIQ